MRSTESSWDASQGIIDFAQAHQGSVNPTPPSALPGSLPAMHEEEAALVASQATASVMPSEVEEIEAENLMFAYTVIEALNKVPEENVERVKARIIQVLCSYIDPVTTSPGAPSVPPLPIPTTGPCASHPTLPFSLTKQ